jgi:hypothetical protein
MFRGSILVEVKEQFLRSLMLGMLGLAEESCSYLVVPLLTGFVNCTAIAGAKEGIAVVRGVLLSMVSDPLGTILKFGERVMDDFD